MKYSPEGWADVGRAYMWLAVREWLPSMNHDTL